MESKRLKKENICTIPNLLSLIRILLIPLIIWLYPIMGMSIRDIRSPQFLISLSAEIAYILVTSAVYTLYRKRSKAAR